MTDGIEEFYNDNKKIIWTFIYIALLVGYIVYFIIACVYDFQVSNFWGEGEGEIPIYLTV